jgi:hypothetical protein
MMALCRKIFISLLLSSLLAGCATSGGTRNVKQQEVLQKVTAELPEQQLLDVWIELFQPGDLPEDKDDARGLSMEIREAEARYMPVHLRGVIERTGYWGAVRIVPQGTEGAEVLVSGIIKESDGEEILLEITATDASGRQWFKRNYHGEVEAEAYSKLSGHSDGLEAVYNAIANDLAKHRNKLLENEIVAIRQIAEMRFAADMLADAFAGHLSKDDKDMYTLVRLPAGEDPAIQRVRVIRERDYQLIDTLNGHYDNFYREMSDPYLEWRKARSTEAAALREVKRKANTQKALGVAAILGAIVLGSVGDSNSSVSRGTMSDVLVIGGLYSIKRGIDTNAQSTIHQSAIEELGESFSLEAKPLVVDVDGEIHELTGSAEAQYEQWRDLMRKIYASETGLDSISIRSDIDH